MEPDYENYIDSYKLGTLGIEDIDVDLADRILPELVRHNVKIGVSVDELLNLADKLGSTIDVYTAVLCDGDEDLIDTAIFRYRDVNGYLVPEEDQDEDSELMDDEVWLSFLEEAVKCDKTDVVFNIAERIGVETHKMFGYYLVMYPKISWQLAYYLYKKEGDMTTEGVRWWSHWKEADVEMARNRVEMLKLGDDV